jgi:hypothetical protein
VAAGCTAACCRSASFAARQPRALRRAASPPAARLASKSLRLPWQWRRSRVHRVDRAAARPEGCGPRGMGRVIMQPPWCARHGEPWGRRPRCAVAATSGVGAAARCEPTRKLGLALGRRHPAQGSCGNGGRSHCAAQGRTRPAAIDAVAGGELPGLRCPACSSTTSIFASARQRAKQGRHTMLAGAEHSLTETSAPTVCVCTAFAAGSTP